MSKGIFIVYVLRRAVKGVVDASATVSACSLAIIVTSLVILGPTETLHRAFNSIDIAMRLWG